MANIDFPAGLEPVKKKLEATVKPYIKIKTRLTRKASLWRSKFVGFPYWPKNLEYPKTLEGEYLYLLAQINFEETPYLEGFPEKGILQFYIYKNGLYGCNLDNFIEQSGFRIHYFPEPDLNENNLITDFSFLPNLWDDNNARIPFYVLPIYTPHKNDCFALFFRVGFAPISAKDYQFEKLVESKLEDVFVDHRLWDEYQARFAQGHKIGGYPNFTQSDPREFMDTKDPYILLLQIDSDLRESKKINIQWGDLGVGNFFIKESSFKRLDFSEVLYTWDCS